MNKLHSKVLAHHVPKISEVIAKREALKTLLPKSKVVLVSSISMDAYRQLIDAGFVVAFAKPKIDLE